MFDPEIPQLSEKEKIERVMAMEREAFAVDPRIKLVRKASENFSSSETIIANTHGALVSYQGTAASSSIEVVAEDGEKRRPDRTSMKVYQARDRGGRTACCAQGARSARR
jgi:predicted Zn-dependent protease